MKKKIFVIISFLFILFWIYSDTSAYLQYIDRKIWDYNVQLFKIILDWNNYIVSSISQTGDSLKNLVNKVHGVAGINGAYFMPKDYWFEKNDTNADRVFEWKQYFKFNGDFWARGMFWFKKSWEPLFIVNNEWYAGEKWEYNEDKINQLYYWISNHPILLLKGEDVLYKSESLIDKKMEAKWPKNFICSRKNKVEILMGSVHNITIYELVDYLKNTLKCYNAILLDSWASRWIFYNWKYIKKHRRPIMDAFVVVDKSHYNWDKTSWYKKYLPKKNKTINKYKILANKIDNKIIEIVNKKFKNKSYDTKQYYIKYYHDKVKNLLLKLYKKTNKIIYFKVSQYF